MSIKLQWRLRLVAIGSRSLLTAENPTRWRWHFFSPLYFILWIYSTQEAVLILSFSFFFFFNNNRLPLQEFQPLLLLNGNQSHHEPRKSEERRAKLTPSKLFLYLLSSHLLWFHALKQYTYGFHKFAVDSEFLTCYVKKKAILWYISFRLWYTTSKQLSPNRS